VSDGNKGEIRCVILPDFVVLRSISLQNRNRDSRESKALFADSQIRITGLSRITLLRWRPSNDVLDSGVIQITGVPPDER
jgi:hypothetical protein